MEIQIDCGPAYAIAYCFLDAGESLKVERGAMAMMSANIEVGASTGGGVTHALLRKALGGESFFMGTYKATRSGSWVAVAPKYPGDIGEVVLKKTDPPMLFERGSFLAGSDSIDIKVAAPTAAGLANEESLIMVKLSGEGKALVSAYGGLQRFDLAENDSIIVDTGHLVGYSATVKSQFGPLGSITAAALSGEGFVALLEGPGQVWAQTRAHGQILSWLQGSK